MRNQINPVVAAVIILVALIGIGAFVWVKANPPTFSKDEVNRLDLKMPTELPAAPSQGK